MAKNGCKNDKKWTRKIMNYNLRNEQERQIAKDKFERFVEGMKKITLKSLSDNRTAQQNRALHKFFMLVSDQLNELGLEFTYDGLIVESISTMYTPNIVKEFIWRPIQIALFDIQSTKYLDTAKMNKIIDVIIKYFADKGLGIQFPSIDSLIKCYE